MAKFKQIEGIKGFEDFIKKTAGIFKFKKPINNVLIADLQVNQQAIISVNIVICNVNKNCHQFNEILKNKSKLINIKFITQIIQTTFVILFIVFQYS